MKTKSPLLTSIGALALFVLVAFPSSSARASQGVCSDVKIEPYYFPGASLVVEVEPDDCWIFATHTSHPFYFVVPVDPSRSGAEPITPTQIYSYGDRFVCSYGSYIEVKAFAWKPGWSQSPHITSAQLHYP
jgi:hypothetical protein